MLLSVLICFYGKKISVSEFLRSARSSFLLFPIKKENRQRLYNLLSIFILKLIVFPGFRPFLNACSRKDADYSRRARSVWKFTMTHSFYPAYGINSKQSSSYTPSISNPQPLSDFFTARRHLRPSESSMSTKFSRSVART